MHRNLIKNGKSAVFSRVLPELLRLKMESRMGNPRPVLYLQSKTFSLSPVSFHSELN